MALVHYKHTVQVIKDEPPSEGELEENRKLIEVRPVRKCLSLATAAVDSEARGSAKAQLLLSCLLVALRPTACLAVAHCARTTMQ